MSDQPGPLLGTGRTADVFDVGGGRVLRRYRDGTDATHEAEVMQWVRAQGVPVPEVFEADGGGGGGHASTVGSALRAVNRPAGRLRRVRTRVPTSAVKMMCQGRRA